MARDKEIVITADSTCDLPDSIVKDRGIIIIPLSILLGEDEYLDGVNVKPRDIYEFVDEHNVLPKTSAVTPARYTEVFSDLVSQGKQVVHIGFSSGLSSTYQNAVVAASELEDVYCVDSKNLCTAMGLLVLKACDMRDKGMSAKRIADKVSKLVPKVSSTFILENLEYLHKGGRCSSVAKFGANVLGIKPSIAVDVNTGKLDVAKKYRGKMDVVYKQYANDCLKDLNRIDRQRVVIANSGGVPAESLAFAKGLVEGIDRFDQIIYADAGCTISSHCGPKTLAIFYISK